MRMRASGSSEVFCARLPVLVPLIIAASLGPDPKLEVARGRRRRRLNCAQRTEAPPTPVPSAAGSGYAGVDAMGRDGVEAQAEAPLGHRSRRRVERFPAAAIGEGANEWPYARLAAMVNIYEPEW